MFVDRLKQQYRKLNYKFDTSKLENLVFKFRGIEEMFDGSTILDRTMLSFLKLK
jgi:preprotein translocase subunit Sec63